jgi:hypothetical protein
VFQRADTQELFTYCASNVTSRRAMGNLLRHYDRMRRTTPDYYPVVRMKVGGFQHRDERVGWVSSGQDFVDYGILSLINSPRIIGQRGHYPHGRAERERLKKLKLIGKFPLWAWTEILLRVTPHPEDRSADAPKEKSAVCTTAAPICACTTACSNMSKDTGAGTPPWGSSKAAIAWRKSTSMPVAERARQRHQGARHLTGDTSDLGIIPGGIRDRAMQAVSAQPETFEKTAASIRYWLRDQPAAVVEAKLRAIAAKLQQGTAAWHDSSAVPRMPAGGTDASPTESAGAGTAASRRSWRTWWSCLLGFICTRSACRTGKTRLSGN